jgi:hypothetical protein
MLLKSTQKLTFKPGWFNFRKNAPCAMKKILLLLVMAALPAFLLLPGCGQIAGKTPADQYIIDVTGIPAIFNCSKSYTYACHYALEEEDTVGLAVAEGDLLYLQFVDEEVMCYRYDPADGLHLSFRYDAALDAFYLNNELISVRLQEGSTAWDWLPVAGEEVLAGIRSLNVYLPLSESEMNRLGNFSGTICHPGLLIEGDSLLEDVITLLEPGWMIAEELDFSALPAQARAGLKHLELLWHLGADPVDYEFLYGLPELRSLIIQYWDSIDFAELHWEELNRLESLTVIESDIRDLDPLVACAEIRNLNIVFCEPLSAVGAITDIPGLTSLGFTGCFQIDSIPLMLEVPSLIRLSFPGNTNQEAFADIVAGLDALEVVEMIQCKGITDLSPLQDHPGLRALTVDFDLPDVKSLTSLSGLELLVLTADYFEDSLAMAEIRKAMPDTRIVAGGGFCLGSGWILLLLPAILLLVMLKQKTVGSKFPGPDEKGC